MGDMGDAMRSYSETLKKEHEDRVKKTPSRVSYAIRQLEAGNIEYVIKNPEIGHFHCWRKSDGKLIQFWAGTGKIAGYDWDRGIHALVRILKG